MIVFRSVYLSIVSFIIVALIFNVASAADFNQIKNAIVQEIGKRKEMDTIVISISGGAVLEKRNDIELLSVLVSPDSTFSALLSSGNGESVVTGQYHKAVMVPVLKQSVAPGTLITEEVIHFIAVPSAKVLHQYIIDKNKLVGMITKKRVVADQLIRALDIVYPPVVKKGGSVTIRFTKGNLLIEAPGTSLEQGAQDQVVRVKNLVSNKILSGKITEPGIVEVGN